MAAAVTGLPSLSARSAMRLSSAASSSPAPALEIRAPSPLPADSLRPAPSSRQPLIPLSQELTSPRSPALADDRHRFFAKVTFIMKSTMKYYECNKIKHRPGEIQ